jgi:hypothetical protein
MDRIGHPLRTDFNERPFGFRKLLGNFIEYQRVERPDDRELELIEAALV